MLLICFLINYILCNTVVFLTHYCAGDNFEKNELGVSCSSDGEGGGMYRVLVEKPEGKRPMRRTRRKWEDDIKMDLKDVECGVMD
jgi:hypothetical protein